ncbi:hypothetical protein CDAR_473011 [Caerostris darwini]|uniref:Uncharacterized protein n=1 Tax=Caerostris darwini TaxID=1538125 RepID=A0AAV4V9G5_9ARAC|nr:hypothetical protein CDAR_473011 [Caerostris darwini]
MMCLKSPFSNLNPQCHWQNRRHIPKSTILYEKYSERGTWWEGAWVGWMEEGIAILISRKRIKYASAYRNEMTSNCFRPPKGITSRECQTDSHTTANNALWPQERGASVQQLNSTLCDPADVLQKQRLNPSLANLGKEAASAETVNLNGD